MAQSLRDDDGVSNPSNNLSLDQVVERALVANPARRALLKAGLGTAALPFLGGLSGCGSDADLFSNERFFGFEPVRISTGDSVIVPPGYNHQAILPWGDPINASAPAFKPDGSNTAAEAERQIGDNHDGIFFFPFNLERNGPGQSNDEGLLVINHEYINPEYYYAITAATDPNNWRAPYTAEMARKDQAGHGVSIVHVRRKADGSWEHVRDSIYNRRIHGNTPCDIQGPAAGHDMLKTAADPTGRRVLGTLNNCGSGQTPWGTYVTCEENFNGYFGWTATRTQTAHEARYGVNKDGFGYLWHTVDPRFDVAQNPNEPNRFGWVVEIDPFNPNSTPIKRTALGRFKHEAAEIVVAPNGKVVVYMGDDERNEYIYKFVSAGTFDRANPYSAANRRLLEEGTLYVARFEDGPTKGDGMGTGRWIPLVWGQNGLTPENGFANQAEVLIKTRQAADRVGATMMNRPEWIAANPKKPGEIYATLTNNNRRGTTPESSNRPDGTTPGGSARPPVDDANPRPNDVWGHIIRWQEAGGDASALTFTWDIFVLAGQPSITGARAPSSNINADNLFNSPDGLQFDSFGRLWIQTDGSFANSGEFANMGNNQMLVGNPATKEIRRFMVGPSGCEVTGVCWTPDRTTMFVNIQHPGEVGSHPRAPKNPDGSTWSDNQIARNPTAFSQWPIAGMRPRSATVVVWRSDRGPVGG
ncbi:MAG: PhoX family phosphatase [Casimicrobiaceae bacterium]|nr:PhoX family phosphatase [Casimicrobiaceae bacterium]MCX8097613.1 PhoX family phosphatase [Casimicrobiaceae bacterium]MDW8311447.1 PhoX family phosphatase [Burkholderiales bacterium]